MWSFLMCVNNNLSIKVLFNNLSIKVLFYKAQNIVRRDYISIFIYIQGTSA